MLYILSYSYKLDDEFILRLSWGSEELSTNDEAYVAREIPS